MMVRLGFMAHQPKAMLIGVDGLPPPLLESLGESLPTIGRLMEEGFWGPLRSTIPYTTAPAWTSMVTGVDPGRHDQTAGPHPYGDASTKRG